MSEPLNVEDRVRDALSPEALTLLEKVAYVAREQGMQPYIAGGSVRDILLGRPHYDLDIAVEGDAIALAHALEQNGVGRVVATHRFGTAELDWHGPRHLDLVTARRERYERPGALPTVEPGTILDDMARRDFTVNAMAIGLHEERIGPLIDPHAGAADLHSRLIRVLHDASFTDDPTRIIRAVKYARRLAFGIELHTLELIFQAVRDGALAAVSMDRIVRELLLVMQEPQAGQMLADLENYGVLRSIHPDLYWPYPAGSSTVPGEGIQMSPEERRDTFLALTASEYATEPEAARELAKALGLDARLTRLMADAARLAQIWPRLSDPGLRPSQIYDLLKDLDLHALKAFARIEAMARDEAAWKNLHEYLNRLRFVKPELGGDYLKEVGVEPGPVYRRLLSDLLAAKLDGEVTARDEEEEFIGGWLRREGAPG